jgi:hypothetical protein
MGLFQLGCNGSLKQIKASVERHSCGNNNSDSNAISSVKSEVATTEQNQVYQVRLLLKRCFPHCLKNAIVVLLVKIFYPP